MNISRDDLAGLSALLDALCDESITPEQMQRLEELMLNYPEAEAYYVQYLNLHAGLISRFGTLPTKGSELVRRQAGVENGTPAKGPLADVGDTNVRIAGGFRATRISRRSFLCGCGVAGLVLTMMVFGLVPGNWLAEQLPWSVGRSPNFRYSDPELELEAIDESVAVLWQAENAEWEPTASPLIAGSILKPGWLRLRAGLIRIEFYSGATVILEGPASFQIISRNEGYCERGTLWATVPPQAHGFRVGSPELTLVDRGTEFGLRVGTGGATEVHVFQGTVEVDDDKAERRLEPTTLTTGQGLKLNNQGKSSPIELNHDAFQSIQVQVERFENGLREKQEEWLAYCAARSQDPRLLVHFPFVTEKMWSRTLVNHATSSAIEHGVIVGCSWESGRWPGKQALGFDQVSDRVRFNVPGEFQSLSLLSWVRVESLSNRFNSLMMTDGWEDGEPHWHIGGSGTLELGIQGSNKQSNAHYEAPDALTPDRLGHWLHLAVVYDGESRRVIHFIDGQIIAEIPVSFDIPLRIGSAELGNWNVGKHRNNNPVRNLEGCMDDFMLFSRALSQQEIEQYYMAGRPPW